MPARILDPDDVGAQVSPEKIEGRFFVAQPDDPDDRTLLLVGEAKCGVPDQAQRDKVRSLIQVGSLTPADDDTWQIRIETASDDLEWRIKGRMDAMMLAIDLAAAIYGQGSNLFVDMKHQATPKRRVLDAVLDKYEVIGRERPAEDLKKKPAPGKRKGVQAFAPPDVKS